jgi:fatty acid desaturase
MSTPTDLTFDAPFPARDTPPPTTSSETARRHKFAASADERGRVLKYKADRGPVAYVLSMFVLHMLVWWFASPLVALACMVPFGIGSMFIAPINHHHQHLNTFRSAWVNRGYDIVLAMQTGVGPYSWVLHHNLGHHRNYLNQHPHVSPDESAWTRRDGEKMTRTQYTLDMLLRHQADIYQVGLRYPRFMRYWLAMKLPLWGLIGVMLWANPVNTLLVFLVPGFFALTHTIWATYEHHAGCDTSDHLVGSVNREHPVYNWMTGNLGLHTAHHKRPGVHWSLLPQVHEEIKDEIPPQLILKSFW